MVFGSAEILGRYNPALFPAPGLRQTLSAAEANFLHARPAHWSYSIGKSSVCRSHGGSDGPAVSSAVQGLGAGYAVSEMVTSRKDLWNSLKTSRRANHEGEPGPIAVQIAGTEALMMAEAAVYNIERGAQIIDINMGCPAKKVCNKWAGSALMQNEPLAVEIAQAVVEAARPTTCPSP